MARLTHILVVLCVAVTLHGGARALDQTDRAALSVEDQLTAYQKQASEFTKQIKELEAAKAQIQKMYNSNEVSVQTLQNVIQQQQNRVSTLETELKTKDSEHGTLRTKLEQLQSTLTGASSGAQEDATKAQAQVQDLQGRLKLAAQEKTAAEKAQQTAEKNAGSLAIEVKRASEHIEKLAERARVAESAQKEAHSQLKSAGLEASTARKLVEAAEQKASEASNQAQELLHKLQNSWTPHWLDQRLSASQKWVNTKVLSGPGGKQNTAGRYLSLVQARVSAFYQQAKAFLLHSHKNLGPHITTAQKHSKTAWLAGKKHSLNAWLASKKHTNTFLASPTVKNGQKQVTQLQRKLEAALRTQMKKYPALQPYARKPYTSYIIYFAAALPAAVFLLPILSTIVAILTGSRRRTANRREGTRPTPAKVSRAAPAASGTPSRTARTTRR